MSEYRTEADFEISADDLWAALRDFGEVSWLPGDPDFEVEGEGVGMIRTIRTPPIPTVREQLDAIDDDERAVRYRVIEGNPMPVLDYRAQMKVVDIGGGRSRLEWSSTWEPDGVSEEDARNFVAGVYGAVMGVMKKNLEKRYAS
jgi:hypothetical protein